jgi:hypothetical protein
MGARESADKLYQAFKISFRAAQYVFDEPGSCIEKYKALGKGYSGIIADVLTYAADHPEILLKSADSSKAE